MLDCRIAEINTSWSLPLRNLSFFFFSFFPFDFNQFALSHRFQLCFEISQLNQPLIFFGYE